jgi:hypothetical protein
MSPLMGLVLESDSGISKPEERGAFEWLVILEVG